MMYEAKGPIPYHGIIWFLLLPCAVKARSRRGSPLLVHENSDGSPYGDWPGLISAPKEYPFATAASFPFQSLCFRSHTILVCDASAWVHLLLLPVILWIHMIGLLPLQRTNIAQRQGSAYQALITPSSPERSYRLVLILDHSYSLCTELKGYRL